MPAEPETISVASGDSLWALAARHLGDGARWTELAEVNEIPAPYGLEVGQVLSLPGTAAPGTTTEPTPQVVDTSTDTPSNDSTARAPAIDEGERLLRRQLLSTETPLSEHLPVVRGGDRSSTRIVQEQLVRHGAEIEVDGIFGVATEDMVRAFQFANRIAVTGEVDQLTAAMLFRSSSRGIDAARIDEVPGIAIGRFETWDAGEMTGTTDVVLLDGARLAAWLAPHWVKMRDAAAADGVRLRFNSSKSGFRTPEDQAALHRRYGLPRAVPAGWSNHQDGHAIDLVMTPDVKRWMAEYAQDFGFVRPTYEEWHWEYRP